MLSKAALGGVIPSVMTPLTEKGTLELANLRLHVQALREEGCDGILLVGTTGEGPSLSVDERVQVIEAGLAAANGMTVLAGTGCASFTDTLELTRRAYELGVDATLIIPPFFFKGVSDQGLLDFYRRILDQAVPGDGLLMLYHFPRMSQVPIAFELIEAFLAGEPNRVAGVKDSSGDLEHLRELCRRFPQLRIFPGNDKLLLAGLACGAAGSITAPSNCFAPLNIAVYRAFSNGEDAKPVQERLTLARSVIDRYPTLPASQKCLLSRRYGTPGWELCPPLIHLSPVQRRALVEDLARSGVADWLGWLSHLLISEPMSLWLVNLFPFWHNRVASCA